MALEEQWLRLMILVGLLGLGRWLWARGVAWVPPRALSSKVPAPAGRAGRQAQAALLPRLTGLRLSAGPG